MARRRPSRLRRLLSWCALLLFTAMAGVGAAHAIYHFTGTAGGALVGMAVAALVVIGLLVIGEQRINDMEV